MRLIWLCLFMCCAFNVTASVDLEKTMKEMGLQFKLAVEAQHAEQLIPPLEHLISLTERAQQATFSDDKAQQFQQGLTQVRAQLQSARAAAGRDDVAAAQQHLRQVDALRKQYHKQRKVSVWQLLFG